MVPVGEFVTAAHRYARFPAGPYGQVHVVPAHFQVSVDRRADGADLRLVGELDAAAVFTLEPVLEKIPVAADTRRIVFDLRKLTFIDSAGLAVLIAAHERFQAYGVEISFIRAPASVMRVFEVTGVDAAFVFHSLDG